MTFLPWLLKSFDKTRTITGSSADRISLTPFTNTYAAKTSASLKSNWSVPIAFIYTNLNWPTEGSSTTDFVAAYYVVNGIRSTVSLLDPVIILVFSQEMRLYIRCNITGFFRQFWSLLWTFGGLRRTSTL